MSIASADAALLSAARAYASLKMTQHSSSASPATNPSSSSPSTPTVSSQPRKPIYYSRAQLLAFHDSPLCVRPPALKPLSEWFGECDLTPPRPPSNALPHSPSNQRSIQLSSSDGNPQSITQSTSNLPVLGRSQPPARNPFANFGKFGAEDSNSFNSLHFNGSNNSLNNPIKGPRRLMDRDGAPHIGRADSSNHETGKRRPHDTLIVPGKDRIGNPRTTDDTPSSDSKPINRRTLDRYVPDRDRDDDRLRNREPRERERDSERDKNRRPSLNPRDGTGGDDHMNWRRSAGPAGSQLNNKRSTSDHHSVNARVDKDYHEARDHATRDKDREKASNHYSQTSHPSNRNLNQQRVREKEKESGAANQPTSQLVLSASIASACRDKPPISPAVPLSSHVTKRVKDGAWDSGQGKWEISKPPPGFQNDSTYGTSETDAIQAWKAEMKALEAKKKLAAATASSQSASETLNDRSTSVQPLKADINLPKQSLATVETPFEVDSKSDRDSLSNSSLLPKSANSSRKPFSFTALETPAPVNQVNAINSHINSENDLAVVPRASRFAKFFDHHKDEAQQFGSLLKVESPSDRLSPTKSPLSPSADPENMARVLSMLQMSSKQTLEPAPEVVPPSQSTSSSLLNKLLPPSSQSGHHNHDFASFLHQQANSVSSPSVAHTQGAHSPLDSELNDRTCVTHDMNVNHLPSATHPSSSSPFTAFAGNAQRRPSPQSSPVLQLPGSEELSSHPPNDHFNHSPGGQLSATSNAFAPAGYGNSGGNPPGSHSIGASTSPSFNLFSTNHALHAKSPVDSGPNGLRNQSGLEPQAFQLQPMLHSAHANNSSTIPVQHSAHDRSTDNQKLAFLTRQLHQQRLSPSHVINQVNGANNLNTLISLNNGSSTPASLQLPNNRQSTNQFELPQNMVDYQRVPMVTQPSMVNGAPHSLQHLNPAGVPNGIMQLPPTNTPHSSLNNLLLASHHQQQAPPHHSAIMPPTVSFTSPPGQANLGNARPGPANFVHQAPQILPGLQHHPINHHQLQLQQQLQQLQRQQGLPTGNFATNPTANPNLTFPFMGPNNRGFGPSFGNLNGFGVVPLVNNGPGVNAIAQPTHQQVPPQPHPPSSLTNAAGLPGLQAGGSVSHPFQHQLGGSANLPQPPQVSNINPQTNSTIQSPLDLMTLLNAGNQRRIGM